MHFPYWISCLASFAFAAPCFSAEAGRPGPASGNVLMIQAAPTAIHFRSSPDYTGHPWLVGVEWQQPSRWLAGYSYFNNSFGQKSHYGYAGYWWPITQKYPSWYFKLTGGVIVGYKEPFEDKIPFNNNGIAPGIIPALGFKMDRFNMQVNLLGTAGAMVTVGYDLVR